MEDKMVSVISMGIESNDSIHEGALAKIPCAYQDAENIYNMFEKALGNNFKKCASVCVKNITSIECKALVSALSLSIEKDDIVIFFFSGHGEKDANGKLQLIFADYFNDGKKGSISFQEIILSLKKYGCPIFIILDCCYSGAGIAESLGNDYKLESSVSIMTSTGAVRTEKISEDGSPFTNAICTALSQIVNEEKKVSIDNIFSYTQKIHPNSNHIIGGGKRDIVLSETERIHYPEDFSQIFINKIRHSNYEMREALWYSVGYMPIGIKNDLLEKYLGENRDKGIELSWRVRRAIGSVYEYGNNKKIDRHIMNLMHSKNWMDKCVGYICARKSKDPSITQLMYEEVKNFEDDYPMDLAWLLALYLADREIDPEPILNLKLMKSPWGAMEVWKRYFNNCNKNKKLEIFKNNTEEEVYKQLCIELYFRKILPDCEELPEDIKKDIPSIMELYGCKTRGRIGASENNKWIFSVLYGNWRDQVDLYHVFDTMWKSTRDKRKLLSNLQYIPSVEIKMAILDYLSRTVKGSKQINVSDLEWALKDQHPWVIRSALPLFQGEKEIVEKNIKRDIDMKIYPGIFDLAIELSKQGLNGIEYQINNMNDIEAEMLKMAIDREQNV